MYDSPNWQPALETRYTDHLELVGEMGQKHNALA
jgi:hypothetical protein